MTEPIPDDKTARGRTWLIAGVLSIVVVLIGVGVSFAVLASRAPSSQAPTFTPAEDTSATSQLTSLTASADGSGSASPSGSSTTTSTSATTSTPPGQIVRSGKIAYRVGGEVYVAGEDGSGAKAVVANSTGRFALSPDGRTLVIAQGVNPAVDHVVLVDVASGAQAPIPLAVDLPTWAPDSTWLAYTAGGTAGGYTVRRADRDGTHDMFLIAGGAQPQISADGKRIAFTKRLQVEATDTVQVLDMTAGAVAKTVHNATGAVRFAWASGGSFYFAKTSTAASAGWLGVASGTMSSSSVVASLLATTNVSPGQLFPSPDGSKVLFAMTGDDGYSQLYVADVGGKKITALSTYRDAYPVGWLLNGSGLLYIDGNVIQKEKPSLSRMNADGTHKKVVVADASL